MSMSGNSKPVHIKRSSPLFNSSEFVTCNNRPARISIASGWPGGASSLMLNLPEGPQPPSPVPDSSWSNSQLQGDTESRNQSQAAAFTATSLSIPHFLTFPALLPHDKARTLPTQTSTGNWNAIFSLCTLQIDLSHSLKASSIQHFQFRRRIIPSLSPQSLSSLLCHSVSRHREGGRHGAWVEPALPSVTSCKTSVELSIPRD